MARTSWLVNAPGPTVQKRSRGRSCWRCSERRRAIQPTYCGSLADWYRNNATRLRRSAVALLELLAAPAGAWIVAADAGIGIRRKRRFGHSTALPALHRRRGRLVAGDETVGRRFRCHHRRRGTARRAGQTAGGAGDAATGPARRGAPARPARAGGGGGLVAGDETVGRRFRCHHRRRGTARRAGQTAGGTGDAEIGRASCRGRV